MALIADEANISQEGKLNVLGVFDRIAAARFPMIHPRMVFVFRVEAEYGDAGRTFPLRVRLIDEDGTVLFDASGEISPPDIPPGEFATANQLFSLVGVQFPAPGTYQFVVNLADFPPYETPIAVVEADWGEPAPGGQGS